LNSATIGHPEMSILPCNEL